MAQEKNSREPGPKALLKPPNTKQDKILIYIRQISKCQGFWNTSANLLGKHTEEIKNRIELVKTEWLFWKCYDEGEKGSEPYLVENNLKLQENPSLTNNKIIRCVEGGERWQITEYKMTDNSTDVSSTWLSDVSVFHTTIHYQLLIGTSYSQQQGENP